MIKSRGFTLIELMIAMVLGLFIVGVTLSIYVYTAKTSAETVKSARLNHDLEMAMHVIVNDLRRAGYWGGAIADSNAMDNPFMTNTTRLQIHNTSCILYSYDADGGDDVDAEEFYGFKKEGNTVRMRFTGTTTNDNTCNDGNWATGELIDSEEIEITDLSFEYNNSCLNVVSTAASYAMDLDSDCPGFGVSGDDMVERRIIDISISGRLVDDPFVTKTLTDRVTVRNDHIFEIP